MFHQIHDLLFLFDTGILTEDELTIQLVHHRVQTLKKIKNTA